MKKLSALVVGICMLITYVHAQAYDTSTYYGKMNYVFSNVNKNLIPTGFLRDYGIEFMNMDNYNGTSLHDSNFVAMDDCRKRH